MSKYTLAAVGTTTSSVGWSQPPQLFCVRRRVGKDGGDTVRIDVESQEGQRLAAGVSPLMHEAERLVDQGIGTPCLRRAVDGVGARSRDDVVKRRSRAMMRRVGRHPCRKRDAGQVEVVATRLQVG